MIHTRRERIAVDWRSRTFDLRAGFGFVSLYGTCGIFVDRGPAAAAFYLSAIRIGFASGPIGIPFLERACVGTCKAWE